MDWIRLHGTINGIPAAVIGIGALSLVVSAILGGRAILQKAAFGLFVAAAVCSVLAFLSGVPAATALRDTPGMSQPLIDQHRYAARLAVSVTVLLGCIGIGAIMSMRRARALSRPLVVLSLLLSFASITAIGWAVYSGVRVQSAQIQQQYLPEPEESRK